MVNFRNVNHPIFSMVNVFLSNHYFVLVSFSLQLLLFIKVVAFVVAFVVAAFVVVVLD